MKLSSSLRLGHLSRRLVQSHVVLSCRQLIERCKRGSQLVVIILFTSPKKVHVYVVIFYFRGLENVDDCTWNLTNIGPLLIWCGRQFHHNYVIITIVEEQSNKMAHWFHRNPLKSSSPVSFDALKLTTTNKVTQKICGYIICTIS